jgi:hypothetical protein
VKRDPVKHAAGLVIARYTSAVAFLPWLEQIEVATLTIRSLTEAIDIAADEFVTEPRFYAAGEPNITKKGNES